MFSKTVSGLEGVLKIALAMITTVCAAPVSYVPWGYCHFLLTTLCACEFFIVKNKQESNGPDEEISQLAVARTNPQTLLTVKALWA